MYCPRCNCEYSGWKEKCPVCQTALLERKPKAPNPNIISMDYAELVDEVRNHSGTLTIEIAATEIETKRGRGFPYIGRGYAWAKHFEGSHGEISARLTTTKVGRDRARGFPYFGYGFAWEKEMQGSVGGNSVTLKAVSVARERKIEFPYRGFGRAWVQEMSGKCGDQLDAALKITEVQQRKNSGFPYFGFGFAWANVGELTLTLAE
jgi:hypothetical protein